MVREIVFCGSRVLRQECAPVSPVDAEAKGLIQDLLDTLEEADGVGLAAPQIGVKRRVLVVDVSSQEANKPPIALVNPVITIGEGMAIGEEGCLSIPDLYGDVPRYTSIEVEALDHEGEPFRINAQGFYARVIQHEIDHLDGKLFIDYLTPLKRQLMRGALKRLKREGELWDKRHLPV
ncbi:peptide deformylase [Candidatus Latescibacterota bacterium]